MTKRRSLSTAPNHQETVCGWVYLFFQLGVLPGLLAWANSRLDQPLTDSQLNFAFYGINFIAVLLIFHSFLSRSAGQLWAHPAYFCQAVILGFVAYYACAWCINLLLGWIAPGYTNANDASIAALSQGNFFLMAIGTVVLVPLTEECLFRGLIFRNLYGTSRVAAYLVSMILFSLIHVIGYIGTMSPWHLVISFLQYLPAGLCLAWSYTKSDTIFAPIVIHALINARGIYLLR